MANDMLLLDKVNYLLQTAANEVCSDKDIEKIITLSSEDSDDFVLHRVMGYSVSDYALATLKWIGSKESLKEFDVLYRKLSDERKNRVDNLILQNYYLEYQN